MMKKSPLKNKIAIVTGANSGVGKEITKGLARENVTVIMACRSLESAARAKSDIIVEVPHAKLDVIELDLTSLSSVKSFVLEFCKKYNTLTFLIENAGIMVPPFSKTEDGFESQMGVNYFSHFFLANLLYPTLRKTEGAVVLSTSSIAHEAGKINFNNLNAELKYSKTAAYSQSKLACLMFAYEFQRRLTKVNSNVISIAAHPGVSPTNLFVNLPKLIQIIIKPLLPFFTHSPENAAKPMLYGLLNKAVKGGEYFGPTGFKGMKGKPGKVISKPHSYDEAVAKKLWEVSEKLTGAVFEVY